MVRIVLLSLIVVSTNAAYLNYHEAIGIPAAARIRESETRAILGISDDGMNTRVVHGSEAAVGKHPWLVGLIISVEKAGQKYAASVCGASLVSQNRLLTAGHCWVHRSSEPDDSMQASSLEVILGSQYLFYGGIRIETDVVIAHPKWTEETNYTEYDAAVIYLPYDVEFNENVYPITLPFNYMKETFEGYQAIGVGYGLLSDVQRSSGIYSNASIHEVVLKVISNAECGVSYGSDVLKTSICTSGLNGVGICQGDSGGPLITNVTDGPILIGITSETAVGGCEIGYPSVFTRVTQIMDFISSHLQE